MLQYVFDPSAGVGAGLNLLCLTVFSKWPPAFVCGWALTKPFWQLLGARAPTVRVPIGVSVASSSSARQPPPGNGNGATDRRGKRWFGGSEGGGRAARRGEVRGA